MEKGKIVGNFTLVINTEWLSEVIQFTAIKIYEVVGLCDTEKMSLFGEDVFNSMLVRKQMAAMAMRNFSMRDVCFECILFKDGEVVMKMHNTMLSECFEGKECDEIVLTADWWEYGTSDFASEIQRVYQRNADIRERIRRETEWDDDMWVNETCKTAAVAAATAAALLG